MGVSCKILLVVKLLTGVLLTVGKPTTVQDNVFSYSCADIPRQPDENWSDSEQSFRSSTTSAVYYCRKGNFRNSSGDKTNFDFEIVRQKYSPSSDKPDSIELTDCVEKYFKLTINKACNFDLSATPSCVQRCVMNKNCVKTSDLCTKKLDFVIFQPSLDLNESHKALYNYQNTLVDHCMESLQNEFPTDDDMPCQL